MRNITKLKCLSEEAINGKRKIKVTANESDDTYFGAEINEFKMGFPLQYAWFAKLVCNKLTDMGYDIERPYHAEKK